MIGEENVTAIKIKHIVRLSTNERSRCHECNYVTGKDGCIDRDVDHYITEARVPSYARWAGDYQ